MKRCPDLAEEHSTNVSQAQLTNTNADSDDDWEAQDIQNAMQQLNILSSHTNKAYEASNDAEVVLNDMNSMETVAEKILSSESVDPVLVSCLENPRERLTLLKFEDQIVRFIKNSRETQLTFPPLSSYHRLMIHRLAERCRLEHQTADFPTYNQSVHDGMRVITLLKAMESSIPSVLLIDLSCERQAEKKMTPAEAPKIMIRQRGSAKTANAYNARANANEARNARTIQDREKAYAEARARIFGDESSVVATEVSSSSSVEEVAQRGSKNYRQASGPDGTRGFDRSQSRQNTGSSLQSNVAVSEGRRSDSSCETHNSTSNRGLGRTRVISQTRSETAHDWKESRVVWRNREEELNDPDFTRHHDANIRSGYVRYTNDTSAFPGGAAPYMPSSSTYSRTQAQYAESVHDHYAYHGHNVYSNVQRSQLDEYNRNEYLYDTFGNSEYAQRSWGHELERNVHTRPSSADRRSLQSSEKRQANEPFTKEAYNEMFPPLGK